MNAHTILVATDLSEESRHTMDWAVRLARGLGARIVLTYVFDIPIIPLPDASILVDAATAAQMSAHAQASLDAEVARVRDRGVVVESLLRQGEARELLPQIAKEVSAGLLVLGSHGRSRMSRLLLGSVTEHLMRTSSVPVVVVPSSA